MHRTLIAALAAAAALTAPAYAQKGPPSGDVADGPVVGVPAPLRPSIDEARALLVGEWAPEDEDEDAYVQIFADGRIMLFEDGGSDVESGRWDVRGDGYGGLTFVLYEGGDISNPETVDIVFLNENRMIADGDEVLSRVSTEPASPTADGWTVENATEFLTDRWIGVGDGLAELSLYEGGRAQAIQYEGAEPEAGSWQVVISPQGGLSILAGPPGDVDSASVEVMNDDMIRLAGDLVMRRAGSEPAVETPSVGPKG